MDVDNRMYYQTSDFSNIWDSHWIPKKSGLVSILPEILLALEQSGCVL